MACHSDPLRDPPGEAPSASGQDEPDDRPIIRAGLRIGLGAGLRRRYAAGFGARTPDDLQALVSRLQSVLDASDRQAPDTFRHDLLALLPNLRRFSHALAKGTDRAEDLVQETLVKAWAHQDRYRRGTDLKAWTFAIMRDQFHTQERETRREVADLDEPQPPGWPSRKVGP